MSQSFQIIMSCPKAKIYLFSDIFKLMKRHYNVYNDVISIWKHIKLSLKLKKQRQMILLVWSYTHGMPY